MVTLAMAIFSIPGGATGDRIGVRWAVGLTAVLTGILGISRAFSHTTLSLAITMFLFGAVTMFVIANLPKTLSMWFPQKEYGLALGLLFVGYSGSSALAMMISRTYLSPFLGGWRSVLWLLGCLCIFFGLIWLLCMDEKKFPRQAGPGQKSQRIKFREGIPHLVRIKEQWLLLAVQFGIVSAFVGLVGFLPQSLIGRGLSERDAHNVASFLLWGSMLGKVIVPVISDRIGRRKIFIWLSGILGFIGCCLLGWTLGGPLMIAAFLAGFAQGGGVTLVLVMPLEIQRIGPILAGTSIGLSLTFSSFGAFLSPVLAGKMVEAYGNEAIGLLVFAGFYLFSVPFALLLKDTGLKAHKVKRRITTQAPKEMVQPMEEY
jgi:NNP family nitrate/nitrite transporter-like MFS transporter